MRRELLVPIDGAPKVQANPELEEVEHAREQKARIARDYRLLRENRQLARLNLYTADRDNRTAATLALDFVEERVRRESVRAVYEDSGIAQYGDRISETSVRRDAAKMFRESETGEDALSDAQPKPRSGRKRGATDESKPRRARKSASSEEGDKPAAKRSARKSRSKTASE